MTAHTHNRDVWQRLFDAFSRSNSTPANLVMGLRSCPPVGLLPSQLETWLFLALIEIRERQTWARRMLQEALPEAVPPSPDLMSRDQPIETLLPDAPEWALRLECTIPPYAVLHNRVTRERIFADVGELGDVRPLMFVSQCLFGGVAGDGTALLRLHELWPSLACGQRGTYDVMAERSLVSCGVLEKVFFDPESAADNCEPDAHRLSRWAVRQASQVRRFLAAWRESQDRLWLAALIGDWPLAAELASQLGDAALLEIAASRAEQSLTRRVSEIKRSIGSGPACTSDLLALHSIKADDLDEHVTQGLGADGCERGREAVAAFLLSGNDARWCQQVFRYLSQCQAGELPNRALIEYLITQRYRTAEVLDMVAIEFSRPGEAALMALKHAPQLARPLVRLALRDLDELTFDESTLGDDPLSSLICSAVAELAVALALIDQHWAHEELRDALDELEIVGSQRYRALPLLLALAEMAYRDGRTAEWEQLFDPDEFQSCLDCFREEMDTSRQRKSWLLNVQL